nr:ABC transporter ATP-binding protein [Pseudobutyrivibrio sp.]
MLGLIKRIIGVSGKYKGRIYGAFVMSFLKGMFMKVPIILMYFILEAYLEGSITKEICIRT